MVTTRRQSKTIDPPALPPVAPPKRKRDDDATPAQAAAQTPNQPSTKRRKKVKSTAKIDSPAAGPADPGPAAETKKKPASKTAKRKAGKQKAEARTATQPRRTGTAGSSLPKPAPQNVTNEESSEDEAPRPPRPAASQDAVDDDADSRYTIGSKRKGKPKKPAAPIARQTAELQFEEDGIEEVDKAQVAVADASNRASTQIRKPGPVGWTPINERSVVKKDETDLPQSSGKAANKTIGNPPRACASGTSKNKLVLRKVPPTGVPCKVVMFTITEAIAALSLYKDGAMSMAAEIDPESRQPYAPLQTGEYLSYPVKGNYHLGALGRYGVDAASVPPFSLTVPLSEYSFIESSTVTSTDADAPSRHGLGFAALPAQPKAPSVRRPNNYCFTFGRYRGRRVDSVPITYLRSIFEGDEYYADAKLQQAFADLYPRGLYESETDSFVFEKGGFKGKRLDEVPKSYVWSLIRKKAEGVEVGGKKGRKALERALEVWEKKQLDLTRE